MDLKWKHIEIGAVSFSFSDLFMTEQQIRFARIAASLPVVVIFQGHKNG